MVAFFEDGTKSEEATYEDGKIVGDMVRYFAKGTRSALIPYENGVPHGNALEWYENGALRASLAPSNNSACSIPSGKNPAVVIPTLMIRSLLEARGFLNQGQPTGAHLKYHPNGKESYKVHYKNGKKQGKEQFFGQSGKLLGEGEYEQGIAFGKHWRKAENDQVIFLAQFKEDGNPSEPIQEFTDQGQKIAEYTLLDKQRHQSFRQWYANGTPRVEFNYEKGKFNGEQREFFLQVSQNLKHFIAK